MSLPTFIYDPANLRHRISLHRPVFDVAKPWEGPTSSEQVAEIWAGIREAGASERVDADQASSSQTMRFVIRHRADLGEVNRLVYDGQSFDLISMSDPDQRKAWLVLEARSSLGRD